MLKAVRAWIRANKDWLNPETAVLTQALLAMAKALDAESEAGKVSSGLMGAYRLTFAQLMKLKPGNDQDSSDDDELLSPDFAADRHHSEGGF